MVWDFGPDLRRNPRLRRRKSVSREVGTNSGVPGALAGPTATDNGVTAMKGVLGRGGAFLGTVGVLLAVPAPASAHEKWFVPDPSSYPSDWSFVWRPLTLTLVVTVVAVTLLWRYIAVHYLPLRAAVAWVPG